MWAAALAALHEDPLCFVERRRHLSELGITFLCAKNGKFFAH